ncbi:MAG TPA: GGDEF domain-containing protein [Devosiaceae bacterium]
MQGDDFKRTLSYAKTAIGLLQRIEVPPYPHFYELFYTYAAGVFPALNARINALLDQPMPIGTDEINMIYVEFLSPNDLNERISNVSQQMSLKMVAVHEAIDAALANANSYSGSLQAATGDLGSEIDQRHLRELALQLLKETRHMQDTNRRLETKLEESRGDIEGLQRDLDEVRRESMQDALTKIDNRKSFDEGLARAIAAANESGAPLSLVLADIDHFKTFNDTFGHQTGDQVLRLVANTLKSNIKGQDMAARYGGEEFAAILPNTDLGGAVHLAENIRRAIQAKELLRRSTNEKLGRITASFGVARFRQGETPASLIERADRCLYAAKHRGRNKVVSEEMIGTGSSAA